MGDKMETIICEAINHKRLLQFSYDDLTRIVEPHLLGKKTSGNTVLSAYMVDGYSESDDEPYWRSFVVDEIEFLVMLDEKFKTPREGYNPDDTTMTEIYCRL
jgi:predicted DNA-binding transcriptional regulator YafY